MLLDEVLHPIHWFEHYGLFYCLGDDFSGVRVHQFVERSCVAPHGDFEEGVDVVVRDDLDETLASGKGRSA